MADHRFSRRTVMGTGLGFGAGLLTGTNQAQVEGQPAAQIAHITGKTIGFLNTMTSADFKNLHLMDAFTAGVTAATGASCVADPPLGTTADVVVTTQFADGKYANFATTVGNLNWFSTSSKDVVVATGGVPSANAAVTARATAGVGTPAALKIPILYMTGRDAVSDDFNTTDNAQGLYLNTSNLTLGDIPNLMHDFLKVTGRKSKHYLLSYTTTNSAISKLETDNWHWGHQDADANNFANNLKNAVDAAAPSTGAKHDSFIISADPYFTGECSTIVKAVGKKIPACYPFREYVDAGGLISYGPNLKAAYRRLGIWAGMVLGSPKLEDLPPLTPSHELVINLHSDHGNSNNAIPDAILRRATDIVWVPIPT